MPDEKNLQVNDQRRKAYTRVIKTRPVTFTCQECGREVTEELYPGARPKYCMGCVREVSQRQNAERQRRYRARRNVR